MARRYNVGGDDYPEYARKSVFSMPLPDKDVIVATRATGGKYGRTLRGWMMLHLADHGDWGLYEPYAELQFPWDHDPERDPGGNVPDVKNEVVQYGWSEPTKTVREYMEVHQMKLIEDEIIRGALKG